jgi:hypothetical protein
MASPDDQPIRTHVRVVKDSDNPCDSCGEKGSTYEIRLPLKAARVCPKCWWEIKIQIRDLANAWLLKS